MTDTNATLEVGPVPPASPAADAPIVPVAAPAGDFPAPAGDSYVSFAIREAVRLGRIDVLERVLQMQHAEEDRRARIMYAQDFAKLLPELPIIARDGRITIYSETDRKKPGGPTEGDRPIQTTPYVQFDDILAAIRDPLAKYGFSIRFEYATTPEGKLTTTAILGHCSGHSERATTPPMQHDSTGSKNPVQAIGSSLTYGMRYALRAVLPIVSHAPQDRDDDAFVAGGGGNENPTIDEEQGADIARRLQETKTPLASFLQWAQVARLEEMRVSTYKKAVAHLTDKARRAQMARAQTQ